MWIQKKIKSLGLKKITWRLFVPSLKSLNLQYPPTHFLWASFGYHGNSGTRPSVPGHAVTRNDNVVLFTAKVKYCTKYSQAPRA